MISKSLVFSIYARARAAYRRANYRLAVTKLKPLAFSTRSVDVNHLLVKALYRWHQYATAEVYLLDMINTYSVDAAHATLMVNVLLKNYDFVLVREVVVTFKSGSLQKLLSLNLERAEASFRHQHPDQLKRFANSFYHLAGYRFAKQRWIFRKALKLPVDSFVKVSRRLLLDPFVSPIMRVSILDTIRKLALALTVKFLWLDHKIYQVEPRKLVELTQTRSYRQVIKLVNHHYFKNPQQALVLKQNLRLILTYLYPFNNRVVTDPELWVKVANCRLQNFQPDFRDPALEHVYCWQVRLAKITRNLAR